MFARHQSPRTRRGDPTPRWLEPLRNGSRPRREGDTGKEMMSEGARDPATMAHRNRTTLGISIAATAGRLPLVLRRHHVVVEILP